MKNKPITLVLIASVILIWGWIMYSVFDFVGSPELLVSKKKTIVSSVKEDSLKLDYVLVLNYKDPFLKKEYNSFTSGSKNLIARAAISASKKAKKNELIVKEVKPVPVVEYVGRIQNTKLKKPIVILLIEKHEYMMQEGEEKEGILLKQIMQDSIKVEFDKKVLYVKKQ
jgi:hypothetical protein